MTEQQYQKKIIDKYEKEGWFVLKLIKTNLLIFTPVYAQKLRKTQLELTNYSNCGEIL